MSLKQTRTIVENYKCTAMKYFKVLLNLLNIKQKRPFADWNEIIKETRAYKKIAPQKESN